MPRRGENICHRKDGRWEARYIKDRDKDGKAVYGYVYGKSYHDAREKQLAAKTGKAKKRAGKGNGQTVAAVAESWILSNAGRWKKSTRSKYEERLEAHILPRFGKRHISAIRNEELADFFSWLLSDKGAGLSRASAASLLTILRQIREHAARDGVMAGYDPAMIRIEKGPPARERRALSIEEQGKLAEHAAARGDLAGLGILLAMFTGLRIGELCGLKWEDMDLEKKELHIRRTVQRVKAGDGSETKTVLETGLPKSKSSIRSVPLIGKLASVLEGKADSGKFVLSGRADRPADPRAVQKRFKRMLKKCGVESAGFHTLRRTFATRCIEGGMDAKTLSEILGHSDVATTLKYYVHTSMEHKAKSMEALGSLIGNASPETHSQSKISVKN